MITWEKTFVTIGQEWIVLRSVERARNQKSDYRVSVLIVVCDTTFNIPIFFKQLAHLTLHELYAIKNTKFERAENLYVVHCSFCSVDSCFLGSITI